MLTAFRIIGYLEGLSFLTLLFIAMPLKYAYAMPMAVRVVGSAHGALFVAYVVMLAVVGSEYLWDGKQKALGFLAAIVPFGPFFFDRYLKKNENRPRIT